jgi:hypothetical protein
MRLQDRNSSRYDIEPRRCLFYCIFAGGAFVCARLHHRGGCDCVRAKRDNLCLFRKSLFHALDHVRSDSAALSVHHSNYHFRTCLQAPPLRE